MRDVPLSPSHPQTESGTSHDNDCRAVYVLERVRETQAETESETGTDFSQFETKTR